MKLWLDYVRIFCAGVGCSLSLACTAADPLAVSNPALNEKSQTLYVDVSVFLANDLVPIKQITRDWTDYSPRTGKNLALISARGETGGQWDEFRVGYLYRMQWRGEANRDSADALQANHPKSDYIAGRKYVLDYRLHNFTADGLRISKSFAHALDGDWSGWTLNWGVAGSYLRGKLLRLEEVSGAATSTGGREVDATLRYLRIDSELKTGSAGFAPRFNRAIRPEKGMRWMRVSV